MAPGGLGSRWTDIPRTITNALTVCWILRIPYLWVDALCIEQPPRRHFMTPNTDLSKQICAIYDSAHLTIVGAAASDCWGGLPAISGKREHIQLVEEVDGTSLQVFKRNSDTQSRIPYGVPVRGPYKSGFCRRGFSFSLTLRYIGNATGLTL